MARFRDLQKMYPECMRQLWALRPEMPAKNAPVAQLDRAPDYESGGQEFESLRARHSATTPNKPMLGGGYRRSPCNVSDNGQLRLKLPHMARRSRC
jgi:hypothetical protein